MYFKAFYSTFSTGLQISLIATCPCLHFRQKDNLKNSLWQITWRWGSLSRVTPTRPSSKPAQAMPNMCRRRTWWCGPSSPSPWASEKSRAHVTLDSVIVLSGLNSVVLCSAPGWERVSNEGSLWAAKCGERRARRQTPHHRQIWNPLLHSLRNTGVYAQVEAIEFYLISSITVWVI